MILYTLKKNEILSIAKTWMNFMVIMLTKISHSQKKKERKKKSQSQKNKYCMILLISSVWNSQNHKNRKKKGNCEGLLGGGGRISLIVEIEISVFQEEKVLEICYTTM